MLLLLLFSEFFFSFSCSFGTIFISMLILSFLDLSEFTLKCEYHVNYSDLDHYHHMNNTKYGDVILNAIDKNLRIKEFEIIYSDECVEGDYILVYTKEEDDIIYVFGQIKSSNLISFKSKLKVERI